MTVVVYADTTDAQLIEALSRIDRTRDVPTYLSRAITVWFADWDDADTDLAAALRRYTQTASCPKYLRDAAGRWLKEQK